MKHLLANLNKAFENKIRLGAMSALMVNESLDYIALRDLLGATDGNLATHLKHLEQKGYIVSHKSFIDRKPNTRYAVTSEGRDAFIKHINAIENLLK